MTPFTGVPASIRLSEAVLTVGDAKVGVGVNVQFTSTTLSDGSLEVELDLTSAKVAANSPFTLELA